MACALPRRLRPSSLPASTPRACGPLPTLPPAPRSRSPASACPPRLPARACPPTSSSRKSGSVDKNRPICEELYEGNSMSIFLTWGNACGKFTHPFFRLWMAHISTIFVHDEWGKNVRPGSRPFSPSLISAVESHARRGTFLLPSSASANPFYLPVFCPAPLVGSPLRAVLAVSPASCVPLGSAISLVPPRPGSSLPFRARQPAVGPAVP